MEQSHVEHISDVLTWVFVYLRTQYISDTGYK